MFTKILKQFDEVLDENHVMFVNLHPNTKEDIDYNEFKYIKPFPNDVPNYEFINSTDALITDYSSIFFDYSLQVSQLSYLLLIMMNIWMKEVCT